MRLGLTITAILAVLALGTDVAAQDPDPYPLEPPDTSSPRATLRTFVDATTEAFELYKRKDSRYQERLEDALRCIDLTQIPPALKDTMGTDTAVLLKEILDRLVLPPDYAIPGADAVEQDGITSWTIPHTEITITRGAEGDHRGDFLFSTETVADAEWFYAHVRHLPYQPGRYGAGWESLALSGSHLFPPGLIRSLPGWAKTDVYGQQVWQWIGLLATLLLAFLTIVGIYLLLQWQSGTGGGAGLLAWVSVFVLPATIIVVSRSVEFVAHHELLLSGTPFWATKLLMTALLYAGQVWLAAAVLGRLADFVISASRLRPKTIDSQLVRLSFRLFTGIIIIGLLVEGSSEIGLPLTAVMAGLGVGGVAVALAAQSTIENLIGGVTLFADRPVGVGDFCRFGATLGFVEEIGLRSTRVRTLERTIVTVPNGEFARMQLENLTQRDQILLRTGVRLRIETSPDQLRFVLAGIREMLLAHPRTAKDPVRVRLTGFGTQSLDVAIHVYARTRDYDEFLGIREDVLLRVLGIVEEAGTALAVPAQTTYLAQDQALDAGRASASAAHIQSMRTEGRLPFPNPSPDRARQIQDTLDFPPTGSPGAKK